MTATLLDLMTPAAAQRQASDPAASVWVGASAGTGKTKVLTDRVLRLMLGGTPPDKILCITFTKAAAAEMANRINRTLAGWATMPDAALVDALFQLNGERPATALQLAARRLFARVLDAPGGMKIQTIHAFCQSLLRRFPLEAGLPPHFEPMDERRAAELLDEVRQQLLTAPEPAVRDALAVVTAQLTEDGFAALMAELAAERGRLTRLLRHHGGLDRLIAAVHAHLDLPHGTCEAALLRAACADGAFHRDGLLLAVQALAAGSKTDSERAAAIAAWLDGTAQRVTLFRRYEAQFLTQKGEVRVRLITKRQAQGWPGALEALEAEAARLVVLAERCRAARVAEATAALFTLGAALVEAYGRAKAQRALLDYDDLILRAGALLHRPGVAPWVLYKLDGGINHVLTDEAQDTNPEQWQVIAALAEEFYAGLSARPGPRTVFAVGDEKQSIFSFQRADPAEFARMRAHFEERIRAAGAGWRRIDLHTSFRSTAAVLSVVDAVFAREAARDGVAIDPATPIRHVPYRRHEGGLVELWPPIGPEEPAEQAPWAPPVEQTRTADPAARLAQRIAATVRGWVDRGERLEARGRPVQPGDIMVLVRTRSRFFAELVRALKERDVPVAGVDRMVLTQQLAVMDLLALADFLLLPEDDLTLAVVLKSPLIGLSEEQLFALAHGRGGTLWAALTERAGADRAFARARDYLGELLARVDFVAPYELFAGLLATPCPADPVSGRRALLGRLGPEAEDALDELLALALSFEAGRPPSLQRFLHWLRAGEAAIKRELEQGGRGRVRIMTVHGAKGLQAPVVILADTMSVPVQSPAILWPERDDGVPLWVPRRELEEARCITARDRADRRRDQEYRRLLYVALTRAEDRLYICGHHGRTGPAEGCWYTLCREALAAMPGAEYSAAAVPGGEVLRYTVPQLRPALARVPEAAPAPPAPLPGWARAPAPAEPEPPHPLIPSRPAGEEPPVRSPLGPDDGARFQRGTLIHTLLQALPELDPAARPAAARRFLARPAHGLAPQEQEAIARETLAVLETPDFAPLFRPGSRAEVPLVGLVGGVPGVGGAGQVLSGQIDRLVVTEEAVLILDYKTNRPPPADEAAVPAVYLRQMAAYRAALRRIYPDRAVRCALLWTDGPRLMPLSDGVLDAVPA